jgi:exopolysaccharide biosynthesis polyprenyl glycosylphosphotransferase
LGTLRYRRDNLLKLKNINNMKIKSSISNLTFRATQNPISIFKFESYILLLLDVIGLVSCLFFAHKIRFNNISFEILQSPFFLVTFSVIITLYYLLDLYRLDTRIAGLRAPGRTIFATIISWAISAIIIYILGPKQFSGEYFGRGIITIELGSFLIWATYSRLIISSWLDDKKNNLKWLAVGTEKEYIDFFNEFKKKKDNGSISFILDNIKNDNKIPCSGTWNSLESFLAKQWSGLIVADSVKSNSEIIQKIMHARLQGFRVFSLTDFYENIWLKVPVNSLKDNWFLSFGGFELIHGQLGLRLKRLFDLFMASTMLMASIPIAIIVSILIKIFDKGPIIYKQIRIGLNGQNFKIYKFRSMQINSENDGAKWTSINDNRITKIGKFLRLTRIDELPQLINVIRGDMSFIGPRPERPEFNEMLEQEIPYYQLRHLVRPGITGWAQVLYPYGASVDDAREKLKYDLYYIKNYSVLLDFSIILKTVRIVLFGRGR